METLDEITRVHQDNYTYFQWILLGTTCLSYLVICSHVMTSFKTVQATELIAQAIVTLIRYLYYGAKSSQVIAFISYL